MADQELLLLKGVLAVAGLGLLLWHMLTTPGEMSLARGLRYVALLSAAGAVAFASQEQVRELVPWESRQWGGMLIAVTVIAAAIASLLEDRGTTLGQNKEKP